VSPSGTLYGLWARAGCSRQRDQPIELWSDEVFFQKMDYIHLNPVKSGFVSQPEDWLYSSAGDYAGRKGLIDLAVL